MHENSKLLFQKYLIPHFQKDDKILEIGPDDFPSTYRRMMPPRNIHWHTLDIDGRDGLTHKACESYSFPIDDGFYDVVFSAQVIEHVPEIWSWMKEIARITKFGGRIMIINPVSWPYHEAPVDCWRIYPEGMKALCRYAGLDVEFSFCGSVEPPAVKRILPGRSRQWQPRTLKLFYRLIGWTGWPVEKAIDNVTIARKVLRD